MTGRRQVLSGSARVAIASNVVAISALAAGWWDILPSAPLPYAVHKLLHIVGVVVFMGNLIAGPVWLFFAYAEDDPRHFRWAARMLSAADIWLTTPGVQLTLWNGLFLAAQLGGVRQQPWIAESVAWVVVASVLSVLVVLPWQERVVGFRHPPDAAVFPRGLDDGVEDDCALVRSSSRRRAARRQVHLGAPPCRPVPTQTAPAPPRRPPGQSRQRRPGRAHRTQGRCTEVREATAKPAWPGLRRRWLLLPRAPRRGPEETPPRHGPTGGFGCGAPAPQRSGRCHHRARRRPGRAAAAGGRWRRARGPLLVLRDRVPLRRQGLVSLVVMETWRAGVRIGSNATLPPVSTASWASPVLRHGQQRDRSDGPCHPAGLCGQACAGHRPGWRTPPSRLTAPPSSSGTWGCGCSDPRTGRRFA